MTIEPRSLLNASTIQPDETPFIERHFAKVAFVVSALALFILQPLTFLFGLAVGGWAHYSFEPNPRIESLDQVMTVFHATLAIIAAVAAFLALTPSGTGIFVRSIAPLFSLSIGSSAYLGFKFYSQ
jgi:hypothetical protein